MAGRYASDSAGDHSAIHKTIRFRIIRFRITSILSIAIFLLYYLPVLYFPLLQTTEAIVSLVG